MPAPISIVIPTLNAETALPACLQALMEGLHAGLIRELIISDGGSTDQTLNIAEEAGAEVVEGPASRGGQLRRGCALAKGDWVLVLHADTVLDPGWTKPVADHLASKTPGAFRLRVSRQGVRPALGRRLGQPAQSPVQPALRRSGDCWSRARCTRGSANTKINR